MIYIVLSFWLITGLVIVWERRLIYLLIYLGVFSVISSVAYLFMAAPDLAMAEIAISAFTTIFFIVFFERYYILGAHKKDIEGNSGGRRKITFFGHIVPFALTLALITLLFVFAPEMNVNSYLARQYIENFAADVGGQNAITAIYLGYRVYDTMLEALMLVIAVVAVGHMSFYSPLTIKDGRESEAKSSAVAVFTIRMLSPILLIYGVYVITMGHMGPGGGFQGGLMIAAFFVCRYMIFDIYDIPIKKVLKLEEIVFITTITFAALVVFSNIFVYLPIDTSTTIFQATYLIVLNTLIGLKVACGFIIMFHRYIAIERH